MLRPYMIVSDQPLVLTFHSSVKVIHSKSEVRTLEDENIFIPLLDMKLHFLRICCLINCFNYVLSGILGTVAFTGKPTI